MTTMKRRPFSTPYLNNMGMMMERKITPSSRNPMMVSQDSNAFSPLVSAKMMMLPIAETTRPPNETKNPSTYLLSTSVRRGMGKEKA